MIYRKILTVATALSLVSFAYATDAKKTETPSAEPQAATEKPVEPTPPSTSEAPSTEKVVTVVQKTYFPPATKCPALKTLLVELAKSVLTSGGYKVMLSKNNLMQIAGKIAADKAYVFESSGTKYALVLDPSQTIEAIIELKESGNFTPKAITHGCGYMVNDKTVAYIAEVK